MIDNLPLNGRIRYIENPSCADVIFIDEYQNIIVDAYNIDAGFIIDKITGDTITLNTSDDFLYCNRFNEDIRPKNMKVGDVAMMYKSKNLTGGKVVRLVIAGGQYEGNIESSSDEYVTIDGTKYKMAPSVNSNIEIGANAEYYLNKANEVVFIKHK